MALILTVDDDPDVLQLLELMLHMHGHRVIQTQDGSDVVDLILEFAPDLVITDILMPGVTGGSVYQMIRAHIGPNMPVIVSTGTKMRVAGPDDTMLVHIPKPINQKRMLDTIDRLIAAGKKMG